MFAIQKNKIIAISVLVILILFLLRGPISYQICLVRQNSSELIFVDQDEWNKNPYRIWCSNESSKHFFHFAKNNYGVWYLVNKENAIGLLEIVGEYNRNDVRTTLYRSDYYYYIDKTNILPEEVLNTLPKGVSCQLITYDTFTVIHLVTYIDPNNRFEFDPTNL